ncbi:hypothetical protein FJZ39_01715 [Candidatus Saccharibacteria bacterium]|nr:hypothetical protein [Candidatus Saccharibacteria bacterium]
MYFESRAQAGYYLAQKLLDKYRYEDSAVIAMSDGGVLVGEQVAWHLHAMLMMLVAEDIAIPGEGMAFGSVAQTGHFAFNSSFTEGQITGYTNEFHGYLEEQKREAFQKINRLLGDGGVMDLRLLKGRNIILVDDGMTDGADVDLALDVLKPVRYNKLIVAVPVSTVAAVDKLHILADDLYILDVKENYMGTNHYYDDNKIPSREETIAKINQNILNWQ